MGPVKVVDIAERFPIKTAKGKELLVTLLGTQRNRIRFPAVWAHFRVWTKERMLSCRNGRMTADRLSDSPIS